MKEKNRKVQVCRKYELHFPNDIRFKGTTLSQNSGGNIEVCNLRIPLTKNLDLSLQKSETAGYTIAGLKRISSEDILEAVENKLHLMIPFSAAMIEKFSIANFKTTSVVEKDQKLDVDEAKLKSQLDEAIENKNLAFLNDALLF